MMVSKPFLSRRPARVGWLMALLTSLTLALSACASDASQLSGAALQAQSQTEAAAAQLQTQSEGALQIDYYAPTGVAHWVAAEGGVLTRQFASQGLNAEGAARAFVGTYGRLFGLTGQESELRVERVEADETGSQHVRFKQQQNGIEVFGADLNVHLDGKGVVQVVNGYTLPNVGDLNLTPTLSADAAAQAAVKYTGLADGVVTTSKLVVLNPGLLTDLASPTYLAYQLRVDSPAQPEKAQWVFVDATTGEVRLNYPAVTESRNRNTYNLQHGYSLGSAPLARNETSAAVTTAVNCSANDVNRAHDYAGNTYDFYFNRFGRDSYNGAGAVMKSYVCYGSNYQNAFWDGAQMVYGNGFPADDVVGHELSHAVTENISQLIYSGQSGALNESFSDIMGESIDLTNNSGNDAATVRWDMGEDIPGFGAIRDMMDPGRFQNPDRTDSPNYYCGTASDYYVHYDSGVQNKAFALMVDGGTFNNYTIAPVGLDKAVKIIYRANDLYLTSSAKFLDAYNAINRSCNELYGGATSADCINVKKALDATKMNGPVCGVGGAPAPTPTPGPTPVPGPGVALVNGGFESGRNVGWGESDTFSYAVVTSGAAQTGSWKAWLVGADKDVTELWQNYTVPSNGGSLTYGYKIASSDSCGFDYAYVQVNGTNLKTYNLCSSNATGGYVQGSVSLSAYAGQTVTLKFRATTDVSLASDFYIDNVGFAAGALTEEVDPHALVGEATPEPKAETPQGEVEEKSLLRQLFLPLVTNQ